MAEELSYVIITPYSLMKSRTGGIISRLLSRSDLSLVGAKILTPDARFATDYAASIKKTVGKRDEKSAKLLASYVKENFSPLPNGKRERIMMLLFKGENACGKLFEVAGKIPWFREKSSITGETIRDTYADLVFTRNGSVKYFEPAVLTPPVAETALEKLELFMNFADKNPNLVENIVTGNGETEKTLTIIKPDNWRHPSTKPGNVIDIFSRTGLRIVGCKVYQMSVEEALEFYGPVRNVLRKKLAPVIGEKAKALMEERYEISLPPEAEKGLIEAVGVPYADDQFFQIIRFMSGYKPAECPDSEKSCPGKVKCMILIYEGEDAVSKIRTVLGPTDPTKAPGGTVRRDFGHNVMINTAHASDSPENAAREMRIVKIDRNNFSEIIKKYLSSRRSN
jgi:nucleoside diphosphate kinase